MINIFHITFELKDLTERNLNLLKSIVLFFKGKYKFKIVDGKHNYLYIKRRG